MKKPLLSLVLLLLLLACNRNLQTQTSVITVDSLHLAPEASAQLAKLGIWLTPLNETQALLTQPAAKTGKTKYKNVGNSEVKQKDVGNVDVGKKAGQQQDVGNVKQKDVGNLEEKSQSYWWVWVLFILTAAGLLHFSLWKLQG
ncbi:hypothetical protein [Pontibacter beigongshangensis]|uniref:hypothetical protein n=1 Tax=Pontibacter beigongshangensis TaxID=2574733 RepID=UPI0016507CEE|nr:hypothetical protein [Pontibacter beigongshangensis]